MSALFSKRDVIPATILAGIGAAAGFAVVNMQWVQMNQETKDLLLDQLGTRAAVNLFSTVQVAVMTFLAAFFGQKLARRAALRLRWIPDSTSWPMIGVVALATALVIVLSDHLIFASYLPARTLQYSFSALYLISGVLYGGIIEEVLLRLLVMSLFAVVLHRISGGWKNASDGDAESFRPWVYWVAISLSALLFAAGHLPANAQLFGLSLPIVIRAMFLNGIGGVGFGYLFWKHGLGSAMAAHVFTHLIMQLILLPLVA